LTSARRELEQQIAALEKELQERNAALPVHSVRPSQLQAIERLEEEIEARRIELSGLVERKGRF